MPYRRRTEEESRRSSRRHHDDDIRIHRHNDVTEFGQRRRGNIYERLGHRPESRREESHLVPVHMFRGSHSSVGDSDSSRDDRVCRDAGEEIQKRKKVCPDYEGRVKC